MSAPGHPRPSPSASPGSSTGRGMASLDGLQIALDKRLPKDVVICLGTHSTWSAVKGNVLWWGHMNGNIAVLEGYRRLCR